MGKINIITSEQKLLLEEFGKDAYLTSHFYFTGGTALSLYYLQHRASVDLDFFSSETFEPQVILNKLSKWQNKLKFTIEYVPIETMQTFELTFPNKQSVKVDF